MSSSVDALRLVGVVTALAGCTIACAICVTACDGASHESGCNDDGDCPGASCVLGACVIVEAACGNGALESGEQCDDGALDDGDGCDAGCFVEAGWDCGGAPSVCQRCGDGVLQGAEECDDGGLGAGDGCTGSCTVEPGYACSDAPSVCGPICSDGLVRAGEACDDGNTSDGDGCDGSCAVEEGFGCDATEPTACTPICGDGLVRAIEECDDGNTGDDDGCDAGCVVTEGFACDAGEPSLCVATCGDGIRAGREECDDGLQNNDSAADACRTNCRAAHCDDDVLDVGEVCDDGNLDDHDDCITGCGRALCGDGFVEAGLEQCDDANIAGGDGCSAGCVVEGGATCVGEPSTCAFALFIVDPTGPGTSINAAVAAAASGATIAVFAGDYQEVVDINAKNVLIVAEEGARLLGSATTPVLHVHGAAQAVVVGLAIEASGVDETAVTIDGAGSSLELIGCSIGPSTKLGVDAKDNTVVTISRSVVHDNAVGGAKIDGGYAITNSVFRANGSASSPRGALEVKGADKFAFNTVVRNTASAGQPAGVKCAVAVELTASILQGNTGAGDVTALCDASTSFLSDAVDALVDDTGHLDELTPLRDAVIDSALCAANDIDGEPRPMGIGCEPGADERP